MLASRIQETLAAIMISTPFRSSKQSQELLRYIVDQSLSGHAEALKERVIGAEVFGRRLDYDTNNDPIVRARVAEVRKRLALYYQTQHGQEVQISVPPGSFKAVFERIDGKPDQLQPAGLGPEHNQTPIEPTMSAIPHEVAGNDIRPHTTGLRTRLWWIAILASAVILLVVMQRNVPSAEARAFNHFWSPILDSPHTTLIYIGGNAVYQLSPAYLDSYYKQHPPSRQTEEMGFESYIEWPAGTKIDAQDLYPAKDTFVTIGDVAAITKIESLLVRRNRQFDIRYGDDVTYGDLRQSPTILVGAHNNSWTLTMTGNLRFVFSGRNDIMDRSDPKKRWSATNSFTEDYAIISRVLNSQTGTTVIAVAGIGYAGTQAAAEFLTSPQSISALVKSLPSGWEKKNIQIVLHTVVTNQLPSPPDVIAIYCW